MIYTLNMVFIFNIISTTNEVNMKIHGVIELGPDWNKYGIAANSRADLEVTTSDSQEFNMQEVLRKDEERLLKDEAMLKQEVEQFRKGQFLTNKKETFSKLDNHKHHNTREIKRVHSDWKELEVKHEREHGSLEKHNQKPTTQKFNSERALLIYSANDKNTEAFTIEELRTIKKEMKQIGRTRHKLNSENESDGDDGGGEDDDSERQQETRYVEAETKHVSSDNKHHYYKVKKHAKVTSDDFASTVKLVITGRKIKNEGVTTVTLSNIYRHSHKVKNDAEIKKITSHIHNQTHRGFDEIKKKINAYHMKKQIGGLVKSYDRQFKEYLKETKHYKIKTGLGKQKVVLNSIDVSNTIINRLLNYLIDDLERKGVLKDNLVSIRLIRTEIDKVKESLFSDVCESFSICRSSYRLPDFWVEVINIHLRTSNIIFHRIFRAMTEVLKHHTNYDGIFDDELKKKFLLSVRNLEFTMPQMIRIKMMIFKNMVVNRNKPLIQDPISESRINRTLAVWEIVDLLDQHLPPSDENKLIWSTIKQHLQEYIIGDRKDIVQIANIFVTHFREGIKKMNGTCKVAGKRNMMIVLDG